jgi:hypothetical protein
MTPTGRLENFVKIATVSMVLYFLYWFARDSYEELFLNPVHFFDDAYMFIRYARIWHLGYGESWNIGEGPVYGNTSQLHFLVVLALTALPQLGNDMVIKLSSYIPSLLLMLWLPWFCARHAIFLADKPLYQRLLFWTATVCPFMYWFTPYAYHFLTGMDTALSTLMHLLLIDVVLTYGKRVKRISDSKLILCSIALILYLSFATRPENILPCGLFVILYFSLCLKKYREVIFVVALSGCLVLLDALFKYVYFNDVVPLAFYSKKVDYLEGFAAYVQNHPLLPVSHFLVLVWPLCVIQLFCCDKKNLALLLAFSIPVVVITLYFLSMMSIMNIRLRYEYPFIMYLLAATIIVSSRLNFAFSDKAVWRKKLFIAFSVLVVLIIFRINSAHLVRFFMAENPVCDVSMINSPADFDRGEYKGNDGLVQMSEYLQTLPAGTKVVMTEHGYVGANNPHINIIDVIGLHSRYIAHHGFSVEWLFAQKPDVIWVPHWNYTCLNHKIFSRSEFWDNYVLYPLLFNWGIALRKDSPHYDVMLAELGKKIGILYPGLDLEKLKQTAPAQ